MNKKIKKHYKVYYIGEGTGCYAKDYCKILIGETWAVSDKKACSNVRYQNRNKENPNGGYNYNTLGDRLEEGFVIFKYVAEEC